MTAIALGMSSGSNTSPSAVPKLAEFGAEMALEANTIAWKVVQLASAQVSSWSVEAMRAAAKAANGQWVRPVNGFDGEDAPDPTDLAVLEAVPSDFKQITRAAQVACVEAQECTRRSIEVGGEREGFIQAKACETSHMEAGLEPSLGQPDLWVVSGGRPGNAEVGKQDTQGV